MKRNFLFVLSLILLIGIFAGCSGRGNGQSEEPEQDESASSGGAYVRPTVEEAAENNSQLDDASINLIQYQPVNPGDIIAVMETSMGEIRIRLFPEHAPLAVENFVGLAEEGYYNGKTFHRIIGEFMIQGGALNSSGAGGTSIYKNEDGEAMPFDDEFTTDLWNFRGALSMANSGPNTNMSQFFIVQNKRLPEQMLQQMGEAGFPPKVVEKYAENGGTPHLDWMHTVFGQVIEGMDVVDEIAAVETNDRDRPMEEIIIVSLTIEEAR